MTSRSTTQILTSATAQYGASPSVANDAGPEPVGLPAYDPGATVLTVGAGKQFATISAAVAAAHDGTVILVDSGTYTNDFSTIYSKISIIGVGGMVNLVATIPPPNSKGIFTVDNDVTIRNLSFSGVAISDSNGGNGAGIRYEGGAMVLRNCAFINNQNGVMGSAVIPSLTTNTITIDHSLFDGNGSGTGYTHNLYIGTGVSKLTFTNNISQNANVGHELKSRAVVNDIEGNVFQDGPSGTASYDIDLPNGGQAIIANNIIEKGPNAENNAMIHFGGEGIPYAGSSLSVTNNTFINDKGASTVGVYNQTVMSATITGNSLQNLTSANIALGPASISGNVDASGALISDSTLTGVLPGSTLVITDTLAHQVTLDGSPYLAVQGGGGLLTANGVAGHITVIGGTGGLNYQETGSSGGNQLTTVSGSVNAIQLAGVGGDTLDSHGTDSILVGEGNLIATISGNAVIADGKGNNKFTVNGTAVIAGHGGNPIVGVGAQGNATITGTVGYLQVTNNGGSARFDITQNGAHESLSIEGGSVDVRVYGGQTNVNTAGGTAGTTLKIGAGPAVVASLGRDTIYAGSGSNTVIVSGAATIYAGTGDLSVFGRSNFAGAKVYGAGGTVTLDGDTGNLTYYGGALANTVFSKLNRDTLIGGTGHMTVIGGSGETIIGGSGGLDFFSPDGGGANVISTAAGSVNTLRLAGSATVDSWGTDTIFGGTDNSIINLHGNAILNGSSGNSTVTISGNTTIYGNGQDRVDVTQGARATIYTGVQETINETNGWVRLISGQASVTVSGGKAAVSSGAYLPISVSTSGDSPVSISASVGMAEITSRGADLIHGGSGGAKIQARGENAQIWGEEGHLWVTGGTNDIITGGSGGLAFDSGDGYGGNLIRTAAGSVNSINLSSANIVDSWGQDTIFGGSGNSVFTVHGDTTVYASSGSSQINVSGKATVFGNGQDNVTVTSGGVATIMAGQTENITETGGTVIFRAGAANATVSGGSAVVTGSANQPIAITTRGGATVTAVSGIVNVTSNGNDVINAGSGTTTVNVKDGNAQIWGGSGTLTVHNQDTTSGDKVTVHGGSGSLTYDQGAGSMTFIGGSGTAAISGGTGTLYVTGGSGRLDVTSGAGGLSFTGGTAAAALSVSSAGGSITFGAAATTVVEAGFGAGVVYNLIGGAGGGANVVTGFRAGVDKLSMQGNLAITSAVSGRGMTTLRFNDGTSLQLTGVTTSRGLFG